MTATPTLLDLARRIDGLDATTDWQSRTELGEALKAALGPDAEAFEARYEDAVLRPTEHVLREMGLFAAAEAKEAADALEAAGAAYRRFRTLSRQADASEEALREASLAWQAAREAVGPGGEAQLAEAQAVIDAELSAARELPPQYPHQLPAALPAADSTK
jgi:multidrug resistance efflux pump